MIFPKHHEGRLSSRKKSKQKKKMELEKHIEQFNQIFEKLSGRGKTQVAIAIMQEMGKDRRVEEINSRKNGNNEKATEKQKWLLNQLGVPFSEEISKKEASALISETLNGNGQATSA